MFDIILNGKNEFYDSINKKIYNILVVNTKEKEIKMLEIINNFILNQNYNINESHYLGIDFEFNKVSKSYREVALMQLCLENDSNIAHILIIYPPNLDNTKILIDLLINKYIIKILHGAESLDIPYIFDQLLINKNNIELFCNNFYDTKYLCDYYNFDTNKLTDKGCSIYELLIAQNIISKEKYDELDKIEERMGPIYLIKINIYKLNEALLKYSLYDVLFLPQLVKKLINYGHIYKNTVPQFSIIINKYKRNVELEFNELEKIINSMNIYYFYYNNHKYILNNIWLIYYDIFISFSNELNVLYNINYFKKFIKIITKFYIYLTIYKKFKIFKSNNNKFIFNYHGYINWISNYQYIYPLFLQFFNNFKYYIDTWD